MSSHLKFSSVHLPRTSNGKSFVFCMEVCPWKYRSVCHMTSVLDIIFMVQWTNYVFMVALIFSFLVLPRNNTHYFYKYIVFHNSTSITQQVLRDTLSFVNNLTPVYEDIYVWPRQLRNIPSIIIHLRSSLKNLIYSVASKHSVSGSL